MELEQLAILDDLVVAVSRARKGMPRSPEESANEPIDKIVGHQPGWANKQTEEAIRSDFTAGMSYTGKKRAGSPARDPFAYIVGESPENIRNLARNKGMRFIRPVASLQEWSEFPVFGKTNWFTRAFRMVQHRATLGFSTMSGREASRARFEGVTVSFGDYISKSGLEINAVKGFERFGKVGVSKRGIVDYLDEFKADPLFAWAREHTVGYTNYQGLVGNRKATAEWEARAGHKIEDAVFKFDISARGEGVYFGLNNVPGMERGSPSLIVQKKEKILEEYRVVVANNEAIDTTYRWGSKKLRRFSKKNRLEPFWQLMGPKSGKPELLEPVFGEERKHLDAFAKKMSQTMPWKVGAFDIARVGRGPEDFMVIEAQKSFGNFSLPWVRWKIERAITGKMPLELKMLGGAAIAATGALLIKKMMSSDKKGSNDRPINKITGHHPGWANKNTEAAIGSDFTAGRSYDTKPGSPGYYTLYRWGKPGSPGPGSMRGADKLAKKWLSSGDAFYAAGSQLVGEAWAVGPGSIFSDRPFYEITMKENSKMLLHSSFGFSLDNEGAARSHVIRNSSEVLYKPWWKESHFSMINPEGAQIIAKMEDVVSYKEIQPKYLEKRINKLGNYFMPKGEDFIALPGSPEIKTFKQHFREATGYANKAAKRSVVNSAAISEAIKNNLAPKSAIGRISSKMGNASYKSNSMVSRALKVVKNLIRR